MNAKERVMRAIDHQEPDRVPMFMDCTTQDVQHRLIRQVGASDEEHMLRELQIDCRWCNCMEDMNPVNIYQDGTYVDMWGVEKTVYGGLPVRHPLCDAESVADLEAYSHWPDPDQIDYDKYIRRMEQFPDYAVFGGMWSPFLEQATLIVGMENIMIWMFEEPEMVHWLLDKTAGFYLECNRRMFEKAKDRMQIFFMGDDYGAQKDLLYGPVQWREFIQPRLRKLYDLAKSYGYKVQQHTCGSVVKIIPDLIETGLDGLHPIQVSACGMEPQVLKDRFGQQLYFAGSLDAMHTLIDGTKEQIEQEIADRMRVLGAGGGFIFGPSQGFLPEIPTENIEFMYRTALKYSAY